MSYWDLLPRRPELQSAFTEAGLTDEQQARVLQSVAFHLREWADYHQNESRLVENMDDDEHKGAMEALREIADDVDGVSY